MHTHVATLIAQPGTLCPAIVARLAQDWRAEPVWLAEHEAADLLLAEPPSATPMLDGVDIVVQPLVHRRKRMLVADMDSTIVATETLDELAAQAGLKQRVAAITARSMAGEIDFRAALVERVALLRGLPLAALEATWAETRPTPGAAELVGTMRAHGAVCALVSGGFTFFTSRVAALLGFHAHRANTLLDDGARLTGTLVEPILGRRGKLDALRALAAANGLSLVQTLAVGDGANDLDMLAAAGLGVAYHARPVVAQAARARIDATDLRALLYLQGYRRQDIVAG